MEIGRKVRSNRSVMAADQYTASRAARRHPGAGLSPWFHKYRRAVCQDFSDALHDFGRVVTGTDDRVPAEFGGVLQHQIESFGARPLAKIGEQGDVAAEDGLQAGPDCADDRSGAHHNPSDDSQGARYFESIQFELRGDHVVGHHASGNTVIHSHGV